MDLGISGKTALVTGGAGTIGRKTAEFLLSEDVRVYVTDVKEDALSVLKTELGDDIRTFHADIASAQGVKQLQSQTGEVDILVHAAGITGEKGDPLEVSEQDWDTALNIDLMSAVRMAKAYIPPMTKNHWGRVVFLASENAAQSYPDEVVYNVAKAGVLSFAKAVSMAYADKGILVNSVAPAFIETNMTNDMMKKRAHKLDVDFEQAVASFLEEERPYLKLKRRGRPEEVAAVIAFLCSERASFVTGSNYRIDGGAVASLNL